MYIPHQILYIYIQRLYNQNNLDILSCLAQLKHRLEIEYNICKKECICPPPFLLTKIMFILLKFFYNKVIFRFGRSHNVSNIAIMMFTTINPYPMPAQGLPQSTHIQCYHNAYHNQPLSSVIMRLTTINPYPYASTRLTTINPYPMPAQGLPQSTRIQCKNKDFSCMALPSHYKGGMFYHWVFYVAGSHC